MEPTVNPVHPKKPEKSEELKKSLLASLKVGEWTVSHEREFIETLFVGRFNAFVVVFSLSMTAGLANTFAAYKPAVFYLGALILFLAWLPLYRGYQKHDRIMRLVFNDLKDHPAYQLEQLMKLEGYKPRYAVSFLMGVTIPWLCIVLTLLTGAAVSTGCLT